MKAIGWTPARNDDVLKIEVPATETPETDSSAAKLNKKLEDEVKRRTDETKAAIDSAGGE